MRDILLELVLGSILTIHNLLLLSNVYFLRILIRGGYWHYSLALAIHRWQVLLKQMWLVVEVDLGGCSGMGWGILIVLLKIHLGQVLLSTVKLVLVH